MRRLCLHGEVSPSPPFLLGNVGLVITVMRISIGLLRRGGGGNIAFFVHAILGPDALLGFQKPCKTLCVDTLQFIGHISSGDYRYLRLLPAAAGSKILPKERPPPLPQYHRSHHRSRTMPNPSSPDDMKSLGMGSVIMCILGA